MIVRSICPSFHTTDWLSSPMHKNAKGDAIAAINLLFASSILLSGNNFEKVEQLMDYTGIQTISSSTFHLYQRLYICTGIEAFFAQEQRAVLESHTNPLVLCGKQMYMYTI